MAVPLQNPEKELRFTRVRQALLFWLLAAVMLAAALTMLTTSMYREINPHLPHPLWAVLPVAVAGAALKLAVSMTRHAYVILTPLGIEIFPLFKPEKGMQMIFWQEIDSVEVDGAMTQLTLHHNSEKTSGIHLTLRPIANDARPLLIKAVRQRISPAAAGQGL